MPYAFPTLAVTILAALAVLACAAQADRTAAMLLGCCIGLTPLAAALAGVVAGAAIARGHAHRLLWALPAAVAAARHFTNVGMAEVAAPALPPTIAGLALVAAAVIAGTQAALLAAAAPSSSRRVCRLGALAGVLPLLLLAAPLGVLLGAALWVRRSGRRAANDNLPLALGLAGRSAPAAG